jgi:4,5-epoxidase
LRDPRWLSAFRIQRQMADRLLVGRCLLAGDAAHVHSPFGGQGMNTGIQDATNLGWKLAAVAAGGAGEGLLDSYGVERLQVAQRVLADTHRQTRAFLNVSGPRALVRDVAVRTMSATGMLDRRIGTSLAGYFDSYRSSPLTHRHDRGPNPRPGDRVPDVPLGDAAPDAAPQSVHGLLAHDRLTLLLVADPARTADTRALEATASRAEQDDRLAVRTVVGGPALTAALGAQRGAALLVRPDGYLVCRAEPREAAHLLEHATELAHEPSAARTLERSDTR